jgi:hypothetical protein
LCDRRGATEFVPSPLEEGSTPWTTDPAGGEGTLGCFADEVFLEEIYVEGMGQNHVSV